MYLKNKPEKEQNRRRCSQKLEREREMGVYMKPKRKRCYFKVLAHGVFNKQWAGKLINWRVKWAKTKTNLYPHMSNINKPISTLGPNFLDISGNP